ncbi:hypothetical protein [Nakamurella sp. PAMC28650]|uniref:hypothetical protein n=1 Tax=Nakamurella sp. PAMC28650 TaxID=2762325 RepID=UPI00164E7FCD|nr:hypothetical protein [Nakamurella sp. PAMC28650]QNK81953.1 hypothetical protein H7F38_03955 [Nakamurella sp. PAMC28650]
MNIASEVLRYHDELETLRSKAIRAVVARPVASGDEEPFVTVFDRDETRCGEFRFPN